MSESVKVTVFCKGGPLDGRTSEMPLEFLKGGDELLIRGLGGHCYYRVVDGPVLAAMKAGADCSCLAAALEFSRDA